MSAHLSPSHPLRSRRNSIAGSHVSSDHHQHNSSNQDNNNDENDPSNTTTMERQKSAEPLARVPMMEGVTTVGPMSSKCPRISALGTLRAIGQGQTIQIVETKGAGNDSEVAAASRDSFGGVGHTKFILSVDCCCCCTQAFAKLA